MSITKQRKVVAGLNVYIYSHSTYASSSSPVVVLFLLHGRLGSSEQNEPIAESIVHQVASDRLLVVAFDQRNHGTRLVDPVANNGWGIDKGPDNERHAIDMYGIQTGTARDISFLIDFLPSYIFPSAERAIAKWGVAGISLGGHATWIALSQEPRLEIGIPIIGCPDYVVLITQRAKKAGIPLAPPYIPEALIALIRRDDPASSQYHTLDNSNPFLGKKVLVLSGARDQLVPWTASKKFVEGLQVGPEGKLEVIVQEDAGHECTEQMVTEVARFIQESM